MGPLGRPGRRRRRRRRRWRPPETGSPSPAQSFRLAARPFGSGTSQVQPRRRVEDPPRVEAGRPAGEVAPQRQKARGGPELVADGEAQIAQRAFVGVEAQDLGARPRRS